MPLPAIYLVDAQNQPIGPFTPEQIGAKLRRGESNLEDLAFTEGATEWQPLHEVLMRFAPLAPPAVKTPRSIPETGTALFYAGMMERFYAYSIDNLILLLPIGTLTLIIGSVSLRLGQNFVASSQDILSLSTGLITSLVGAAALLTGMFFVYLLASWLYEAFLDSSDKHGTWGKQLFRLKVLTTTGQPLTFWHATGRYVVKGLSNLLTGGLGNLVALFTPRKQALHDFIVSTVVVKDRGY